MNRLVDIFDTLENWDFIKSNKGVVGIFFNNSIHSSEYIGMEDEIVEIRHGDLTKLWDFIPEESSDYSVFIGVSYEANPRDIDGVKNWYLEDGDVDFIEYDPFSPLEVNNKKLVEADVHVIIPPANFDETHIIGRGLLNQIQERKKAGKTSEIYVDYEVCSIKDVYELKGNDNTKAAVVIC